MSVTDGFGLASVPVAPIPIHECRYLPGPHYWAYCVDADAPPDWSEEGAFSTVGVDVLEELLETPPLVLEINPHGPHGWPESGLGPDAAMSSVGVGVTHDRMPMWAEAETRTYSWQSRQLLVYVGDLGDQIDFGREIGSVQPLSVEWRGQSLAGAFLGLNLRNVEDVLAFFRTFGAPRDRGRMEMAGVRWERSGLERSLKASREAADGPSQPTSLTRRWAPSFGHLQEDEDGMPVLVANLWELARLSLVLERRGGRVGFCEAAAPWASGPCGRPFIAARIGRRRYCSPECQSRASSKRAYARAKARDGD